jgi:hypothetical protein
LNLIYYLNNHFLARFSYVDPSFQINNLNRKNIVEVRLDLDIDQKKNDLFRNNFGGNIDYIKTQDTYYYSYTSFGSAKYIVKYFY